MIEQNDFRTAMARLGGAVNLITTSGRAGRHGMVATAVCSVTDSPPTLLVSINRAARSNAIIKENGCLCVNVLGAEQSGVASRFASALSSEERFACGAQWDVEATGSPVLHEALTSFDCQIDQVVEVGTHSLFVSQIKAVRLGSLRPALFYFNRSYCELLAAP